MSKKETETLIEEGRYITRPDGNGNPSRTSVNLDGDAAIAKSQRRDEVLRASSPIRAA